MKGRNPRPTMAAPSDLLPDDHDVILPRRACRDEKHAGKQVRQPLSRQPPGFTGNSSAYIAGVNSCAPRRVPWRVPISQTIRWQEAIVAVPFSMPSVGLCVCVCRHLPWMLRRNTRTSRRVLGPESPKTEPGVSPPPKCA